MIRLYNVVLILFKSLKKDFLLPLKFLRFLRQYGIKKTKQRIKYRLGLWLYYNQNNYQENIQRKKQHTSAFNVEALKFKVLSTVPDIGSEREIAVILHLYYLDMWDEISYYLLNLSEEFDLFISLNSNYSVDCIYSIMNKFPKAHFFCFGNRGRDIFPFVKIYEKIKNTGYKFVCKLHTKKSSHLYWGDMWRRHSLECLLGSTEKINEILELLSKNNVGIVVPWGNRLYYKDWKSGNESTIKEILSKKRMNYFEDFYFPSGSMFWFKPDVFEGLVELIKGEEFEPEKGQVDGTLAHAIERMFGLVCYLNGYNIIEYPSTI